MCKHRRQRVFDLLVEIVKTVGAKIGKLIDEVRKLHSYEVPEIIALPIVEGFEKYLQWIDESLE